MKPPNPNRSEIDQLALDLDNEFGKKSLKDTAAARNKAFHERISGKRDPLAGANEIARSWRDDPSFEPIRRITYVHLQTCRSCGHSVQYIANAFTEYESKRLKARVKVAETVVYDALGFELPNAIETHLNEVEECVDCIYLNQKVERLVAASLDSHPIAQYDIFSGAPHAKH